MFNIVKYFYGKGYYTNADVKVFVASGSLTEEEYKLITRGEMTA